MVKQKSLLNPETSQEIKTRILNLKYNSQRKWGRMDVAQMIFHCDKVLEIPLRKTVLPKINFLIYVIGNFTKFEMKLLNNGIPPNMPTFKKLIVTESCNFEECRKQLLNSIDEFILISEERKLPNQHALFGEMTKKDWGFMEYKHLNHHLKQFGV